MAFADIEVANRKVLLLTIHDLAKGLNDKKQIDAVLLDFSKAFDRVPHERLLLKLQHYGVRGKTLGWARDFLSSRTQQVLLEGEKSNVGQVISGVSQGTVLGPLLWRLAGYGAGAAPLASRRVRCWGRSSSVSQGTVLGLLLWRLAGYGAGADPLASRRVRCWGRSSSVSQGTVLGPLL